MVRSLLHCTLVALLVAGALSSCQKAPEAPDQAPGAAAPLVYSLSIPAAFDDEDSGTKAVAAGTGEKEGWLVSTFLEGENISVYNKTKNVYAQDNGYNCFYLHTDAAGPKANLTGSLKFFEYGTGYVAVEVGDVLLLGYNFEGYYLNYTGSGNPQLGSLKDLSRFDGAVAEVTVTDVSGSAEAGYTLTTGPAVFRNVQSMFKFTFTGLPESLLNPYGYTGIISVIVHSAGDKLSMYYYFDLDVSAPSGITIEPGSDYPIDGYEDASDRRQANGPGVVYAALRFLPLDDENATDLISFTVECTDGNTYIGSKASPKGGFQNGKYYTASIPLAPSGAVTGRFIINTGGDQVYFSKGNLRYASGAWSFFDNQWDYYTTYSADAWDKFGWSTSASTYGKSTSDNPSNYSGDFVDWGATMGTGWRTLTQTEWAYLFANSTYAMATVNGVTGIILLPDDSSLSVNTAHSDFSNNVISASDWNTVYESAGAVFLPAAGARNSGVTGCGTSGCYWSSTATDADRAKSVSFEKNYIFPSQDLVRYIGASVRLVRNVE